MKEDFKSLIDKSVQFLEKSKETPFYKGEEISVNSFNQGISLAISVIRDMKNNL